MRTFLSYFAAFGGTLLLLHVLRSLAPRIGLMDHPGSHRLHKRATPLVGGLAMFCGFLFAVLLVDQPLMPLRGLFAASALLVIVGVLDDFHELSARSRFTAQIAAALIMMFLGGVVLTDLGRLLSNEIEGLGNWYIPLTIFATVGVINALNMSDGLDGLAGGLSVIALILLAVIAVSADRMDVFTILLLMILVVAAFLSFNVRFKGRRARVFMGDAGSMFLGFVLSWFFISLSQGDDRAMTPVTAVWILAIPLFDTICVMFRRILRRQSPFKADRHHLHHILLALGLSVNQTLLAILGAAAVFGAVGFWGLHTGVPEWLMFYTFLGFFGIFFISMTYGWRVLEKAETRSAAFQEEEQREKAVIIEIKKAIGQ